VHGEGGSGGALAAAAGDAVLVTPTGYFAAIGPEGASAALRAPAEQCADRMRIVPADLLALGFADALVAPEAAAARLAELAEMSADVRLAARAARWSGPLAGTLSSRNV
jgi:acetyl-CoA carboxylase carboxyl transferase subunit beta